MRPTTAIDDNVFDFDYLLHPGSRFEHPRDVVSHPGLNLGEKRAILASWASDASAIASCPSLRAPEGLKAPVTIDEILEALCALDGGPRPPPGGKPFEAALALSPSTALAWILLLAAADQQALNAAHEAARLAGWGRFLDVDRMENRSRPKQRA